MNKKTPYEQQLAEELKHLQLPDEDQAWAAMKQMLDEKDNNRPPVAVPMQGKGCTGWAAFVILLLLAGGAAYFFLARNQNQDGIGNTTTPGTSREVISSAGTTASAPYGNESDPGSSVPSRQPEGNEALPGITPGTNQEMTATETDKNLNNDNERGYRIARSNKEKSRGSSERSPGQAPAKTHRVKPVTRAESSMKVTPADPVKTTFQKEEGQNEQEDPELKQDLEISTAKISMEPDSTSKEIPDSTETVKAVDSVLTDTVIVTQNKPQDTAQRKKIVFAAGLAIQQAINLNGSDPGLMGTKPYERDYMPSVYFRLHREKWFLQGEFRYGAPQNINGFTYRTINMDTVQGVSFATSYALRRIYTHQFPVSLHYIVKPGWSIGAGVIYNRFAGTISEKSLRLSVAGTPVDTILEKRLVNARYDSAFAKSTWQWMAESQYKWKRFSFGLRYASGLQPFIRYRDAEGIQRSKRQQSLNLFIRYELWRSSKQNK